MQGLVYAVALACLLGAYGLSQSATIPYIRAANESASISYIDFLFTLPYTFVFALWIGFSHKKPVPPGVFGQGLLLVATVALMVFASSVPAR